MNGRTLVLGELESYLNGQNTLRAGPTSNLASNLVSAIVTGLLAGKPNDPAAISAVCGLRIKSLSQVEHVKVRKANTMSSSSLTSSR